MTSFEGWAKWLFIPATAHTLDQIWPMPTSASLSRVWNIGHTPDRHPACSGDKSCAVPAWSWALLCVISHSTCGSFRIEWAVWICQAGSNSAVSRDVSKLKFRELQLWNVPITVLSVISAVWQWNEWQIHHIFKKENETLYVSDSSCSPTYTDHSIILLYIGLSQKQISLHF